jgi:hypothetical protein
MSLELWDYSSNCRRFFLCHAVNWEPLGQFTSNFAQLLELIVLRSVHFLVKFRFFNVYKNQQSRQTGSRNLMGPKTLPTIWYTYMMLVTKYQISAINSYWEKCDEKYLGCFKFHRVIGIDGLTVCILYGEISNFHSRVMGLYSSNCRRFFLCHAINWEPLRQFTSSFALLLELIVFTDFSKNELERDMWNGRTTDSRTLVYHNTSCLKDRRIKTTIKQLNKECMGGGGRWGCWNQ